MIRCDACQSDRIKEFKKMKSFPSIIFPVDFTDRHKLGSLDLSTSYCTQCGLIFQDNINLDFITQIYKEQYFYYPFTNSELQNESYRFPFYEIMNKINLNKMKNMLEIGTSNPNDLEFFLRRGLNCYAINNNIPKHEEITFIEGFYGETVLNQTYDLIVARFVLEHVTDINQFFLNINKNLSDHGIVVIQVPNPINMMLDDTLNFIVHEHIRYFSRTSLLNVFKRNGFKLLLQNEKMQASIIMVFQRGEEGNVLQIKTDFYEQYKQKVEAIKTVIVDVFSEKEKWNCYGAGLSLSELLYNCEKLKMGEKDITIFDDNPVLDGRYMPGSNIQIEKFGIENLNMNLPIMITSRKIYQKKIIEKLLKGGKTDEIFSISEIEK